ncbi:MAG: hypothetical protein KKF50_04370 [Nanoarchaeota archaeon]|nr:hypothetical protein [Nanoarchaeota archaeon]
MIFKRRLIYSALVSAAVLVASIIIPIVPCRKSAALYPPIYKWTLCSLNPDKVSSLNSVTEYFGYTTTLTDSFLLTIIISFVLAMVFFHFTARRKKR